MILCHRAVGSMKQNILRNDSKTAFKSLARILLSGDLVVISFVLVVSLREI